jgi:uncharacterized protein (TIGR02284 family)
MAHNHDVSKLDDLIVTTIDSIKGYEHAAAHAKAEEYADYFLHMAARRQEVVQALSEESRRLGGTPAAHGSAAATIHRRIEDIRRVLGGGDAAILAEIEHGEAYLDEEFGRVLADSWMDPEVLTVVRAAYESVRRGREGARALRDELRAAA